MSSGETLLTVGALILLTFVILNYNRSLSENEDFLNETRFGLETMALATSIIEEASQLPFDEMSWDSTIIEKLPTDLGPDYGETNYATFDDFDDFNNYAIAETTMQNIYSVSCKVNYVSATYPDSVSVGRTYFKKLKVTIRNTLSNDSLSMNYVHGFWFFN